MTSTTVRGSRASAPREPVLHLRARDRVERAEGLVEAQHRLAREQRARERDALAHAARELARVRALEAAPGRARRTARARARAPARAARARRAARAPRCRARRATAAAGRAGASAPPARCAARRRPAPAARRSARAASSCRSRSGRRRRAARRGATRSETPASARTRVAAPVRERCAAPPQLDRCRRARAARLRLPAGAWAGLQFDRHFAPFAGITPQVQRVGAGGAPPGRHLSRPAASPPGVCFFVLILLLGAGYNSVILTHMVRLGSWIRPAGESPVRVSAGAPGSRPRFVVERSGGLSGASRASLEGASAWAGTAASSE